jgi:hypothetical protein
MTALGDDGGTHWVEPLPKPLVNSCPEMVISPIYDWRRPFFLAAGAFFSPQALSSHGFL